MGPVMHELALCQGLIRQVIDIAGKHSARAVLRVNLRIGPLSGVEPALLRQAFPLASAGSIAADAVLAVEQLPVRVHCSVCGADSDASPNRLLCAECGDWRTQLISGDELLLDSVELVDDRATAGNL